MLTFLRNINVFGLAFIITFACIVVTLDIFLLKFLVFVSKFRRASSIEPRIERWVQDGVLQLQRRAYEAQGQGTWIDIEKDIPMTTEKAELEDLSLDSVPVKLNVFPNKMDLDKKEFTLKSAKTWGTQDTVLDD